MGKVASKDQMVKAPKGLAQAPGLAPVSSATPDFPSCGPLSSIKSTRSAIDLEVTGSASACAGSGRERVAPLFRWDTALTTVFTVLPKLGVVGNSAIMNVEPVFALVLAWAIHDAATRQFRTRGLGGTGHCIRQRHVASDYPWAGADITAGMPARRSPTELD